MRVGRFPTVKRLVKLLVPLGVLAAVLAWLQRRPAPPTASPTAPPEPAQRPASYEAPVVTPSTATDEPPSEDPTAADWVEPTADGGCPDGYPVKAKTSSKIFHVPEGDDVRADRPGPLLRLGRGRRSRRLPPVQALSRLAQRADQLDPAVGPELVLDRLRDLGRQGEDHQGGDAVG